MSVRTRAVASKVIGEARSAYEEAAGRNDTISKTEAKKLPKDLKKFVDEARESNPRVRVNDAVDAYADHVSYVLSAVDTRGRGSLTEAEANRIRDPSLKRRVLDVRAELSGTTPTPPSGGGSSTGRPGAADVVANLGDGLGAIASWHDSGDNGVDSGATAHPGVRSFSKALEALGSGVTAGTARGDAAILGFIASATERLLQFTDGDGQSDIDAFAASVQSVFGNLTSVRSASGPDSDYLLGKARDGYVSLRVQTYSDG